MQTALATFYLQDVMGFDPRSGAVPMTPHTHCGHCGCSEQAKTRRDCIRCGHILRSVIDYGCLTDALVWAYVFGDLQIDLFCIDGLVSFNTVARLLPLVRNYSPIHELGHQFFKLECYFVTHVVLAFSDWGQHLVCREMFQEEFEFIANNMAMAVRLKDPEIVGEFVFCLKILQVSDD